VGPFDDAELRDDMLAFAGSNGLYYATAWWAPFRNKRFYAGFNWAAFFFTASWLAYRKLFILSLLYLVASGFIVFAAVSLALVQLRLPSPTGSLFGVLALAPFKLILGFAANGLYLSQFRKIAGKKDDAPKDDTPKDDTPKDDAPKNEPPSRARLVQEGGTSKIAVVALLALILAVRLML